MVFASLLLAATFPPVMHGLLLDRTPLLHFELTNHRGGMGMVMDFQPSSGVFTQPSSFCIKVSFCDRLYIL